jgi:hypothetical protein
MPASILIHGPAGCGKTHHKEALGKFFGLTVIDDHKPLPGCEYPASGFLYLSERAPTLREGGGTINIMPFHQAMAMAGLETKPARHADGIPMDLRWDWRIVNTDNWGGDYPNERFLENIPPLTRSGAQAVADVLNAQFPPNSARFYKVEHKDYKLQPGFEP